MYLRDITPGSGAKLTEGEIVANIPLPRIRFKHDLQKCAWGVRELGNYVGTKHGLEYRDRVEAPRRMDRLTGTKVSLIVGEKKIRYMLVEPKKQDLTNPVVHIVRHEENLGEGDFLDAIIYRPRVAAPTMNLGELLKQKLSEKQG